MIPFNKETFPDEFAEFLRSKGVTEAVMLFQYEMPIGTGVSQFSINRQPSPYYTDLATQLNAEVLKQYEEQSN